MRRAEIALLTFILALSGCGHPAPPQKPPKPDVKPPTVVEAKTIVADSPDFGEYEFTKAAYTLPLSRAAMNEPAQQTAADLRRAGWLSFSGDAVVLTARAKDDKRFVVRPNGFVDVVPLAKKELLSVEAVRPSSEGVEVDFTWHWIPNEIGSVITTPMVHDRFTGPRKSTATLIRGGGAWMILRFR